MLLEWISSCFLKAHPKARKNGLVSEIVAFEYRGRRQKKSWKSHLDLCHQLALDFTKSQIAPVRLLILGSGCLYEIPIENLCQICESVHLVDLVFPRAVLKVVKKYPNLHAHLFDLTTDQSKILEFSVKQQINATISANILSQLSVFQSGKHDPNLDLERAHWDLIQSIQGKALVWSDYERLFRNSRNNAVLETSPSLIAEKIPGRQIASWDWNLAPSPEYQRGVDYTLKMKAWTV